MLPGKLDLIFNLFSISRFKNFDMQKIFSLLKILYIVRPYISHFICLLYITNKYNYITEQLMFNLYLIILISFCNYELNRVFKNY